MQPETYETNTKHMKTPSSSFLTHKSHSLNEIWGKQAQMKPSMRHNNDSKKKPTTWEENERFGYHCQEWFSLLREETNYVYINIYHLETERGFFRREQGKRRNFPLKLG